MNNVNALASFKVTHAMDTLAAGKAVAGTTKQTQAKLQEEANRVTELMLSEFDSSTGDLMWQSKVEKTNMGDDFKVTESVGGGFTGNIKGGRNTPEPGSFFANKLDSVNISQATGGGVKRSYTLQTTDEGKLLEYKDERFPDENVKMLISSGGTIVMLEDSRL